MATFKLTKTGDKKGAEPKYEVLTPLQLAWRRFRKNKLALLGTVIVLFFLFLAIFAPIISPYPYDKTSYNVFVAPGKMPEHILGTDDAGRDFLSRVIWGANTSLTVGVTVQLFALVVGLILGITAAWFGGFIDFVVNHAWLAVPDSDYDHAG
jgi:peptide/nickel transport system permease protein